ncbi:hypothetical protein LCGC14_0232550 [marine sediment metagenome]|uniref:Uncharacterized protein n=1 Tax=marine sediment metagenome TaxID=412755 RepID=A0A0F9UEP1_9ZZZZ
MISRRRPKLLNKYWQVVIPVGGTLWNLGAYRGTRKAIVTNERRSELSSKYLCHHPLETYVTIAGFNTREEAIHFQKCYNIF